MSFSKSSELNEKPLALFGDDFVKTTEERVPNSDGKRCFGRKTVIAAVVLAIIAAAGTLIGLYFGVSSFHHLANRVFSQIAHGKITIGQSLLYIALPILGSAVILGLVIHLYKKYQIAAHKINRQRIGEKNDPSVIKQFLKEIKPTKRQMIVGAVALTVIAILAVGSYFVFHYVGAANQWMHSQALPALQRKILLWQALAGFGGGSMALALITGVAIYLLQRRANGDQKLGFIMDGDRRQNFQQKYGDPGIDT